jgi:hypothetical protein
MHTLFVVLAYVGGLAGLAVVAVFLAALMEAPAVGVEPEPPSPEPGEAPVTAPPPASSSAPPPLPVPPRAPPHPDAQAAGAYQRLVDEYQAGLRQVYGLGEDILEGRPDRHE